MFDDCKSMTKPLNVRSKPLNVRSETLNVRSETLNVRSEALNRDFIREKKQFYHYLKTFVVVTK